MISRVLAQGGRFDAAILAIASGVGGLHGAVSASSRCSAGGDSGMSLRARTTAGAPWRQAFSDTVSGLRFSRGSRRGRLLLQSDPCRRSHNRWRFAATGLARHRIGGQLVPRRPSGHAVSLAAGPGSGIRHARAGTRCGSPVGFSSRGVRLGCSTPLQTATKR